MHNQFQLAFGLCLPQITSIDQRSIVARTSWCCHIPPIWIQ